MNIDAILLYDRSDQCDVLLMTHVHRYWLFSRYSTGWKCGLHADYTELTECLAAGRLDELEEAKRERRYAYRQTVMLAEYKSIVVVVYLYL